MDSSLTGKRFLSLITLIVWGLVVASFVTEKPLPDIIPILYGMNLTAYSGSKRIKEFIAQRPEVLRTQASILKKEADTGED